MPYQWVTPPTPQEDEICARMQLWPYRSMPKVGFVWFMAVTAIGISLPLFAVLGTSVLWGLLPAILITMGLLWTLLQRNYRDAMILEDLLIDAQQVTLRRDNPRSETQFWEANPYWVDVKMHPKGGPVANYVTLRGNGREVEIGAFLSDAERENLFVELDDLFRRFRQPSLSDDKP